MTFAMTETTSADGVTRKSFTTRLTIGQAVATTLAYRSKAELARLGHHAVIIMDTTVTEGSAALE